MKAERTKVISAVVLGLLFVLVPVFSFSQDYPTKPVNVIVTFAPGGTLDTATRILAAKADKFLGQPVIVSNVGGGGGSVALAQVATKKPDGYEITSCTSTGLIRIPQLRAVPYGPDDFISVMHFAAVESGVVVKSDSPFKTFKDLVEFARKNPGKVTYATSGAGSPMHMAMEFVAMKENIQWTHVPQTGGAPGLAAVLGGHVTAMSDSTEWLPHVKEGSLRLLATHGENRMKSFPDVPTFRDLGYDFINETVFMIAAPKGTPAPVIKKLDESFRQAMDDPQFVQTIASIDLLKREGFLPETRLYAHGQGYDLVERPLIRDDEPMKLQAGMNITVHPTVGSDRVWVWVCDNYLVTKTGVGKCLHETPKEIIAL